MVVHYGMSVYISRYTYTATVYNHGQSGNTLMQSEHTVKVVDLLFLDIIKGASTNGYLFLYIFSKNARHQQHEVVQLRL